MATPIMATKLFIPSIRSKIVHRPKLIQRLNEGLPGKLTLISASAGFGKTTLISQWISGCKQPAAWLSLDREHKDPSCFLTYFISALQTIFKDMERTYCFASISPETSYSVYSNKSPK
jgi:LuxR family maltose regulon positive regulatory protein